ncbi:MAG: hypothetical protein ACLQED_10700 [Desulfobaccales bacterium]
MNRDFLKWAAVLGLVLVGLALSGCGESRSRFAGAYRSVNPVGEKNYSDLDLEESGKGTWTLAGKSTEFNWVVKDGRIWIYLKTGAIILFTPSEGGKELSADMTGEWHPGCSPNSCVVFKRVSAGG